jgi:hypothetical protein
VPNNPWEKLKILFITAPLYDNLGDSLLIGFRELYGANCIDFPRKSIMYGEFPVIYGRGFTLWTRPIEDVPRNARALEEIDLVIYSNYRRQKSIDWRLLVKNRHQAPRVVYLDGNDDAYIDPFVRPLFKRELFESHEGVFPIGFGVPERFVRSIHLGQKKQLHQTHVQDSEFTQDTAYKFTREDDYYDDLARSCFGITMRKAGWDCLRHYEMLAAGTLVMFKHFDQKPPLCAPQCPYFISYTDKKDFFEKAGRLWEEGKPNDEYVRILQAQREWLLKNATCTARARQLMLDIQSYFEGKPFDPMPVLRFKKIRLAGVYLFLLKESLYMWGLTLASTNPLVNWLYYRLFGRIPGAKLFVTRFIRVRG